MARSDNSLLNYAGHERQRAETESHLEKLRAIYRFHFFFAGLVFAILSFAIQFRVQVDILWVRYLEATSWIVLGLTGLLALKQIGGFSLDDTDKYHSGLSKKWRRITWILFVTGVGLLLLSKIIDSICGTAT